MTSIIENRPENDVICGNLACSHSHDGTANADSSNKGRHSSSYSLRSETSEALRAFLLYWKRGHNKACKDLAAAFQDRLFDALTPAKLKIKEARATVEDVAPAEGFKAAPRLSAVQTTAIKASAPSDDTPDWRGTCAICLDLLPVELERRTFYDCCCKWFCNDCSDKCRQHDKRCPLCRTPACDSEAEMMRRLQKHVDKGNAEAQFRLGDKYCDGANGLKQSFMSALRRKGM
jgi:TPR repeat protein